MNYEQVRHVKPLRLVIADEIGATRGEEANSDRADPRVDVAPKSIQKHVVSLFIYELGGYYPPQS